MNEDTVKPVRIPFTMWKHGAVWGEEHAPTPYFPPGTLAVYRVEGTMRNGKEFHWGTFATIGGAVEHIRDTVEFMADIYDGTDSEVCHWAIYHEEVRP